MARLHGAAPVVQGMGRRGWLGVRAAAAAGLLAAVCPDAGAQPGEAPSPVRERLPSLESYIAAAEAAGFSGVILVGEGDEAVLLRACGAADADLGVPIEPHHRFRLGSLTKPITASAVLVAVEQGALSLDARVGDLVPGCPSSWRDVTVHHLLSHTSGIPDHFGDLEAVPVDSTRSEVARLLRRLDPAEPTASAPGAEYAYSNFNYVLLGIVLEEALGLPWERALHRLVLSPLGITTIAYDDVHAIMPDRVHGYARDDSLGLRNIDYDDHAAYAAGGLLGTASDLFRWSRAVFAGRVFGPDLLRRSLRPVRENYGYGWQIREFFGRTVYNHTGGIDGFSSHLAYYPDHRLTVIVLTNVETDAAILRACDLANLAFGWNPEVDPSGSGRTPGQRCGLAP